MTHLLKALKFGAVLWICVVLAASGVSGMVLCIGEDGHVTLEWSQDGECQGGAETACDDEHGTHSHLETEADDCCGDCIDIAFPSDSLSRTPGTLRRMHREQRPLLPHAVLSSVLHVPQAPLVSSIDGRTFPPGLPDGLLLQRTIMLLI